MDSPTSLGCPIKYVFDIKSRGKRKHRDYKSLQVAAICLQVAAILLTASLSRQPPPPKYSYMVQALYSKILCMLHLSNLYYSQPYRQLLQAGSTIHRYFYVCNIAGLMKCWC